MSFRRDRPVVWLDRGLAGHALRFDRRLVTVASVFSFTFNLTGRESGQLGRQFTALFDHAGNEVIGARKTNRFPSPASAEGSSLPNGDVRRVHLCPISVGDVRVPGWSLTGQRRVAFRRRLNGRRARLSCHQRLHSTAFRGECAYAQRQC